MAMNIYCDYGDDDYIDMEIASYTGLLFHHHRLSNSHAREFEFQMSSKSLEKDTTTSPADELFYKGKLLPLHLPPRLQMVEKLLETSSSNAAYEDFFSTPLETNANSPTTTSTPYESCQVSRELNREEYLMEYSRGANGFTTEDNPKSVTKKLKPSILSSKLKASKAYLKSLFSKSSAANERNVKEETVSKPKESSNAYAKMAKKTALGQIHTERYQICTNAEKEKVGEDRSGCHRRSFSVAFKRHLTNKYSSFSSTSNSCSSSSSSCNSSGLHESRYLKRCSSSGSEIEKSIQGAIAHCKQSQQLLRSTKNTNAAVFCSFSAVCEEQEKPGLCRG